MRVELTQIKEIEAYLEGNLPVQEERAFEEKMNADPLLKEEVALQRALTARVKDLALMDAIATGHTQFLRKESRKGLKGVPWGIWLLLALTIVGAAAIGFLTLGRISPQIGSIPEVVPIEMPDAIEPPVPIEGQAVEAPPAEAPAVFPVKTLSRNDFPAHLQVPFTTLEFRAEEGYSYTYPRSGTKLTIPANAFVDPNGKVVKGIITLKYREFRDQADMAFSGIPMFEGRQQFVSTGMFELRAFQNKVKLEARETNPIEMDFKLTERLPNTNFYELNDRTQQWKKLGELTDGQQGTPTTVAPDNFAIQEVTRESITLKKTFENSNAFVMVEQEAVLPKELESELVRKIGYPAMAREAGIEGMVVARVRVSETGVVEAVKILKSSSDLLSEPVKSELLKVEGFIPAIQSGKAIATWITIPFRFKNEEGQAKMGRNKSAGGVNGTVLPANGGADNAAENLQPLDAMPDPKKANDIAFAVGPNNFVRLRIGKLRVYNCDHPNPPPVMMAVGSIKPEDMPQQNGRLQILASFEQVNGMPINDPTVISVVDLEANSAFSFPARTFSWTTEGQNALVLYTRNGQLYGVKNAKLEERNITAPGAFTFEMEPISEKVQTRAELRAWLVGE